MYIRNYNFSHDAVLCCMLI